MYIMEYIIIHYKQPFFVNYSSIVKGFFFECNITTTAEGLINVNDFINVHRQIVNNQSTINLIRNNEWNGKLKAVKLTVWMIL
jgi:hypothetical protein